MVPPLTCGIYGPFYGSAAPLPKLALRASNMGSGHCAALSLANTGTHKFHNGSFKDHLPTTLTGPWASGGGNSPSDKKNMQRGILIASAQLSRIERRKMDVLFPQNSLYA
jgi:hypothetical protein